MNSGKLKARVLLGSLVTVSSFSLAQGTDDSAAEAMPIEETLVRGQYLQSSQINALRSPTPILDVPQSLSIVTSEVIMQRGYGNVSDIIQYLPGVSVSQGEGHRDAVVFRGVRSTADFFIDGVRDDVQYYRPLYNLEQLEILRGPNALLFGRGGTGGILNRVTKKPELGQQFSQVSGYADTFGAGGVQIDTNWSTSDDTGFRLNAMLEGLENHRDFYDGERLGINPTFKTRLGDNTLLNVSYEYVDHEQFIDRGIPTGSDGRPVEAFEKITFGDEDVNLTTLKAHIVMAGIDHQFSDSTKGKVTFFYGDYDKSYQNFYASGYTEASTPNEVTLDGYVDTTQRQNTVLSGSLINESILGGTRHRFIAGAEVVNTSSDQDRWNTYWSATADDKETFFINRPLQVLGGVGVNSRGAQTTNDFTVDINDDTRVSIDVYSAFIQDEISITEKFDVILGARFDHFEIDVFNVPANDVSSRTDEEVSPRLGLVYKPVENMSLYGSYSESFLPRSGEQFANINGSNGQLDPNTFENLEVGFKWDFGSGLSLTAAAFQIQQTSPQVADNDPSTLDVIETETDGVEIQLDGQLTDFWYLSASYTYLDGEQVGRTGPSGRRPRELPENMFSVWNSFQFSQKFSGGLGLTYQDESFINNSNSAVLPSYTRVDAALYYQLSNTLRIQVNVENLTDTDYYPSSHSTHQATVGAPLNARFAITKDF
jgi:catecholate siderophore receptor